MYDKAFLTGSDENNEWMLEWWLENYKMHNSLPVIFADFGVSKKMRKWVEQNFDQVLDLPEAINISWFMKPLAMLTATDYSKKVCWIDTDCHILKPIEDVFKYVTPNKLSMVRDKPWTDKFLETWHNSGVVAFEGVPEILMAWENRCRSTQARGDQEVLHDMMGGDELRRRIYIEDIPNTYNWLRLQVNKGHDSPNKKIMHWTGPKGKDIIRELIGED